MLTVKSYINLPKPRQVKCLGVFWGGAVCGGWVEGVGVEVDFHFSNNDKITYYFQKPIMNHMVICVLFFLRPVIQNCTCKLNKQHSERWLYFFLKKEYV